MSTEGEFFKCKIDGTTMATLRHYVGGTGLAYEQTSELVKQCIFAAIDRDFLNKDSYGHEPKPPIVVSGDTSALNRLSDAEQEIDRLHESVERLLSKVAAHESRLDACDILFEMHRDNIDRLITATNRDHESLALVSADCALVFSYMNTMVQAGESFSAAKYDTQEAIDERRNTWQRSCEAAEQE